MKDNMFKILNKTAYFKFLGKYELTKFAKSSILSLISKAKKNNLLFDISNISIF